MWRHGVGGSGDAGGVVGEAEGDYQVVQDLLPFAVELRASLSFQVQLGGEEFGLDVVGITLVVIAILNISDRSAIICANAATALPLFPLPWLLSFLNPTQ